MSAIASLASTLTAGVNDIQNRINSTQTQLSSNKKTLDPAQQGVVTRLGGQVSAYNAVGSNIGQAKNIINVAQTGLNSISSMLVQMKDIATKSASAGLTADDLTAYQATFDSLSAQITALSGTASLNGSNLLNNATGITVQTGLDGTVGSQTVIAGIDATALTGLAGDLSTVGGAQAAIDALEADIGTISGAQSTLTASGVALTAQDEMTKSLASNLQSTIDYIQKPDQAALQIQLTDLNTQHSIDLYLIGQMNTASQAVLSLFR